MFWEGDWHWTFFFSCWSKTGKRNSYSFIYWGLCLVTGGFFFFWIVKSINYNTWSNLYCVKFYKGRSEFKKKKDISTAEVREKKDYDFIFKYQCQNTFREISTHLRLQFPVDFIYCLDVCCGMLCVVHWLATISGCTSPRTLSHRREAPADPCTEWSQTE